MTALKTRSTDPEISSKPVFDFPLEQLAGVPLVLWKRDESGSFASILSRWIKIKTIKLSRWMKIKTIKVSRWMIFLLLVKVKLNLW